MKFDVSANNELVPLVFIKVADGFALSFVVGAALVIFFVRFVGACVSLVFTVPCFCSCLHFARLFLNQTYRWKIKISIIIAIVKSLNINLSSHSPSMTFRSV